MDGWTIGGWDIFVLVGLIGYWFYLTDRQNRRQHYQAWALLFERLEKEKHSAQETEVLLADYSAEKRKRFIGRLDRSLAENLAQNDEALRWIFSISYKNRRRYWQEDLAPPPSDAPKEVRDAWHKREEAKEAEE